MTEIRCPVNEAADISRNEPALITGARRIIYSEYDQFVTATAERLQERGCREGDRVALAMPNHWQYAVLLMALFRAKAVACPIPAGLPAGETRSLLDELGCSAIITPDGKGLPAGRAWRPDDLVTFFTREPKPPERAVLCLEQPATVFLTGGRTGARKAVLHTLRSHYYGAKGANNNLRASSGCRWLASMPLSDVGGLSILMSSAVSGAAVVLPLARESLRAAIERYGVTHLPLTAAQLRRLLAGKFDRRRFPKLRAILLGDGPVARDLLARAYATRIPVHASYALTEMAFQVTTMAPSAPPAKRFTLGTALKYRDVRIAADGEILVRGRTLFAGYVEGKKVRPAADADGWFATGDLGSLDADGYLTVSGKKAV